MNVPLAATLLFALAPAARAQRVGYPYRFTELHWVTPGPDADASVPLGNGDVALNAWVDPEGDLWFYVAKGDAWSENGRLLKVGRVRIALDPPPPVETFNQVLELRSGTLSVRYGDDTRVRLWVDAHAPVVHVDVEAEREVAVTASIEPWRTKRVELPEAETSDLLEDRSQPNRLHERVFVEPDTLVTGLPDAVGWFHHNARSTGPALIARLQGLEEYFEGRPDPLLHRTFGALVTADGGERLDDRRLRTPPGQEHHVRVAVLTEHPSSPDRWQASVQALASEHAGDAGERRAAHVQWWEEFWDRSRIDVDSDPFRAEVPNNDLPARIGVDQAGGNRFAGRIARLTVVPRPLDGEQIAALARIGPDQPFTAPEGALFAGRAEPGAAIEGSGGWSFPDGLTIEAWLEADSGAGRILDKITPGGSDGMLLDTHPGRGLRLIAGRQTLAREGVLEPGRPTHVAGVVDERRGVLELFLDGALLAEQRFENLPDAWVVSRAYALQRYVTACAGRGRYPIKFNGSLFTVPAEGQFGDADYRRWGPGYWWQNTRLPYLSLCASGDFELMRPLFRMYAEELLPLHRYRTERYTGHAGAFIPECIYFWGPIFSSTYGWTPFEEREDKLQESGWHKWEWVSGLELAWMMLDYWEHTLDEAFARDSLLPAAHEFLTFFDEHYPTGADGRLVMEPSQALETWWDCTNPMPEVAGLHAVTARLLALPEGLGSASERAFWAALQEKLPPLPTVEEDGVARLAPAERFADKRNVENPELYAVFPFRLVSFEKPNAALGVEALRRRLDRGNFGWRQDDLFHAYLGLADGAREHLVARARNKHAGSRFPAFWGPNYDWVPDQDHGGVLMRTLQAMVMQTEGRRIFVLPAWPTDWDVDFDLHAPYRTTVSGRFRDGRLEQLEVEPAERRADVVVCVPQATDR